MEAKKKKKGTLGTVKCMLNLDTNKLIKVVSLKDNQWKYKSIRRKLVCEPLCEYIRNNRLIITHPKSRTCYNRWTGHATTSTMLLEKQKEGKIGGNGTYRAKYITIRQLPPHTYLSNWLGFRKDPCPVWQHLLWWPHDVGNWVCGCRWVPGYVISGLRNRGFLCFNFIYSYN